MSEAAACPLQANADAFREPFGSLLSALRAKACAPWTDGCRARRIMRYAWAYHLFVLRRMQPNMLNDIRNCKKKVRDLARLPGVNKLHVRRLDNVVSEFSVWSTLICKWSAVFDAMINSGMREGNARVEIKDFIVQWTYREDSRPTWKLLQSMA
jgi:hypothetical protein